MVSTMAEAANGFNNGRSNGNKLRSTGHKQEEGTDYTKLRKAGMPLRQAWSMPEW